jgi:3D (Asp-Asp-Asp) domain-containing protein
MHGKTASGERPREGETVAADPDVLPIGTEIEIRGAGEYSAIYTVEDSGPAIYGRKIDILINNRTDAKEFGRHRVRVRVIERPTEVAGRQR